MVSTEYMAVSSFIAHFFFFPTYTYAQDGSTPITLRGIVDVLIGDVFGGVLIPLAVGGLLVAFTYGVAVFLQATIHGSTNLPELAKNRLFKPTVVLLIIFTLWGVMYLLRVLLTDGQVT